MGKAHSISLVYDLLRGDRSIFPWYKRVWSLMSNAKQNFHLWKVMSNALNTKDKLFKIGIIPDDICVFCHAESECNTHLFFECNFVYQVWKRVLDFGKLHQPSVNNRDELFNLFKATRWKSKEGMLLLRILKIILLEVWSERNRRVFTSIELNSDALFFVILKEIFKKTGT